MYLSCLKKRATSYKLAAILLLIPLCGNAQVGTSESGILALPLREKTTLSGNFSELRGEHFHSGFDFKVGGVVGAHVLAADDGYVWQVRVSPVGYGKAVYLRHPNGYTTVYAHLNAYAPKLAPIVEQLQYSKRSFAVDTIFEPDALPVKKGELLGYAGNTGSSMGPHLHFEVRDANQTPLNPANFYKVTDNIAPELCTLGVFTIDSVRSVPVSRTTHLLDLKSVKGKTTIDSTLHVESPAYFGIEAYDRMNGTANRFAIRNMWVEVDSEPVFELTVGNIPFNDNRYLLSLIAYGERATSKKTLIKTYVEPANRLDVYRNVSNCGVVNLTDDKVYSVIIRVADDNGNMSSLSFKVKQKKKSETGKIDKGERVMRWDEDSYHLSNELLAYLPKGSLYNNLLFDAEKLEPAPGSYSPVFRLHSGAIPLHKPIDLAIKADVPDSLKGKAVAMYYANDISRCSAIQGKWANGYLNISANRLGYYFVSVDTVPPTITPLFKKGADLRAKSDILIKIKDAQTGIQTYDGYIDDKWVLFEYDAKNDLLVHTFNSKRIAKGKKHTLKLVATDAVGNQRVVESTFTW